MANIDQPIANPTFHQNIKAMFSQYDMVMMQNYFDFRDYNQVKAAANMILLALQPNADPKLAAMGWSQLQQVHVMPEVPGPWPQNWVTTFKNWVTNGCPEGTPPVTPDQPAVPANLLNQFIALSMALTGIDDFGPNAQALAAIYYNRLLIRPANAKVPNDNLGAALAQWTPASDLTAFVTQFPICNDIITIWYTTSTNWDDKGNPVSVPYFGTPQFNQYQQGLLWKVGLCHPTGYAPEVNPFYWQTAPDADGTYSGFFTKNY